MPEKKEVTLDDVIARVKKGLLALGYTEEIIKAQNIISRHPLVKSLRLKERGV